MAMRWRCFHACWEKFRRNGQNIFDPTTYPFPVAYTILPVHDLWLRSIVIDSDNNRSETIHHQQEPTVDLQITD